MLSDSDISSLPSQCGIYIFWNEKVPIYVGKSVNISARVKSHIQQAKLSKKEHAIVENATKITYLNTLTNFDALILEAKLIREYQPRYNVLWKDDKHYLYIKIDLSGKYPFIYPVRRENDGVSLYFGPFRSTYMTEKLLFELRKIIPFCTSKKIMKRPCFYSRIGLCDPCPSYIEQQQADKLQLGRRYKANINKVTYILSGKTGSLMKNLETQLKKASDQQNYEKALILRNKIHDFSLFLDKRSFSDHFIGININIDRLNEEVKMFLNDICKHRCEDIYRIECFDMSNLFGQQPTGSMVVYSNGEFQKKEYRIFNVNYKGISDIHMMKEVIARRLDHDEWQKPDLILLDGGKPQLLHISKYFTHSDISIPLLSIAKHPDRIISASHNYRSLKLDQYPLMLRLFQSIRDEAHRFAKKHHVAQRNRSLLN